MELIEKNLFDTSTSITVNSNTATVDNLFVRDLRYQYVSSGLNDDNTTCTLTVSFGETLTVSRIALMGMNLKSFTMFYNGATANLFSLTSTGATTASDFTSNSETAMYLTATPVDCTSVTIDMKSTQSANQEKALGYLVLSNLLSDLDGRIPSSANYIPTFKPKEIVHELSDGSFRSQVIDRKFSCQVALDFVDTDLRSELKTVFDRHDDLIFCAFGTTTAWDEVFFPCIWVGAFDFFEYSDNSARSGHSGSIKLFETRPG